MSPDKHPKEYKRLSRLDLLDLLVEESRKNQKLEEEIQSLKKQLEDRRILLEESGSIAEAALRINEVFAAADAAAKQYLDNIKRMNGEESEL